LPGGGRAGQFQYFGDVYVGAAQFPRFGLGVTRTSAGPGKARLKQRRRSAVFEFLKSAPEMIENNGPCRARAFVDEGDDVGAFSEHRSFERFGLIGA